ncbi:uncharacterized protein LOC124896328 [Capsicum annuum]|uniref:uncharacterized protein LOC124896328 n=1 Tax=Capsicum annuum TaxID=4072 RepID=UPI001FB09E52|nr:uncharacterized protein LOC124896328 [Capsicum annuum]
MDDTNNIRENSAEVIESVESKQKKAKSTISDLWKCFTNTGKAEDGIEREKCNGCKIATFEVGTTPKSKNYGTSHLRHHKEMKMKILRQLYQKMIQRCSMKIKW